VLPTLERDEVRRTIQRHRNDLRVCYNRALRHDPQLAGRVMLTFMIEGGAVTKTKIDATDRDFETCLDRTVRRWTFPSPPSMHPVVVNYPVVFALG